MPADVEGPDMIDALSRELARRACATAIVRKKRGRQCSAARCRGGPASRDDGRAVRVIVISFMGQLRWNATPCRPPFGFGFGPKPAAGAFKAAGAPRSGHARQPRQTSPAGRREGNKPRLPARLVRSALVRTDPEASSFRRFFWTAPEGRAGRGRLEPSARP